jgi:hypothetical protein
MEGMEGGSNAHDVVMLIAESEGLQRKAFNRKAFNTRTGLEPERFFLKGVKNPL